MTAEFAPWTPGSLLTLGRFAPAYQRDPLRALARIRERFGPTAIFGKPTRRLIETRPFLITSDPPLVRAILQHPDFRNSAMSLPGPRGSAQRRIRRSLFRLHGDEYMRQRLLVAPALSAAAVASYRDPLVRIVESVTAPWKAGDRRDMAVEMKSIARHVAASTLFGLSDLDESARIGRSIESWWAHSFEMGPRLFAYDLPGTPYRAMLRKAEVLEREIREIIERKREAARSGGIDHDLLSRMIRSRDEHGGLSEADLVGQTQMLFLAAHETTSYALTWALFLLAQHPRVAAAVVEELGSVLGGEAPELDQLDALPRLGRVLDESLRIVPIAPYGVRVAGCDLELAGRTLPRRSRILIPFHLLHHRPEYFREPRRFDPDRWLGPPPPAYTYLPFSAGRHTCLGASFAMLTLKVTLASVLQRFSLRVVPGARIDRRVTVTLSPRQGMPMELRPPEAGFERVAVSGNILDLVDCRGPER